MFCLVGWFVQYEGKGVGENGQGRWFQLYEGEPRNGKVCRSIFKVSQPSLGCTPLVRVPEPWWGEGRGGSSWMAKEGGGKKHSPG